MEQLTPELIQIIIYSLVVIAIIRLIMLFHLYWSPFKQKRKENKNTTTDNTPPVSIIVYAHQAVRDLEENIPFLMQQDYPEFEVIVVNEMSEDGSEEMLELLSKEYPNLKQTFIPNTTRHLSNKKLSISVGVKTAKYNTLLFTEAYCRPQSNLWIREMVRQLTPSKNVVLGYSSYSSSKSLPDYLFGYYRFFSGLKMFSSALRSRPFIATNENLLYTKDFFFKNNGFADYLFLESGEDDLFINKKASKEQTAVCYTPDSLMQNRQKYKKSFRKNTYFNRISTYQYLSKKTKIVYKIEEALYWIQLVGTITAIYIGLFFENYLLLIIASSLYLISLICKMIIFRLLAKKLRQSFNPLLLLIFNWLLPFRLLSGKLNYRLNKKDAYTYCIK